MSDQKLKDMNQDQVITWIQSLSLKCKDKIMAGIKEWAEEEEIEYEGKYLVTAGLNDIMDVTGLNNALAMKFMEKVSAKKDSEHENHAPTDEPDVPESQQIKTFTLKIEAKFMHKIENADKTWTIAKCKFEFLQILGQDGKAALYASHASQKWSSPGKSDGIEFKCLGKNLKDHVTLESLGITHGRAMALVTAYRVKGGAEMKEEEQDAYDKIRPRKLKRKAVKEAGLILSKKPCCIMGYSDSDGIRRAEMPCGCAFAADTMFRYMKSLFDKNLKAVKPICPVSKGAGKFDCKGNDTQRAWDWGQVFTVADLSDREISRFTKAIENRLGSTKNCPNCGAVTEKNKDVRISRVSCTACTGRDWCWNCEKTWNYSGLGPICGNKGCMADRLNTLLKPDNCGTMKTPEVNWYTTNGDRDIVKTRACPKCLTLLEFDKDCKHMKCIACPHQFCHNCLRDWNKRECTLSIQCNYHPPQTFR